MENTNIEKVQQIEESIKKLDNKEFGFYFFVMDTKGNPLGWVANVYDHVKTLNEIGIKSYILHEKNDYTPVTEWLGEEYSDLPHISIESQQLKVSPSDFLVIPEIYANIMEQTVKMPCKRIVLSQCYDYILEILNLGSKWTDYNITDVITTSEKQKRYINSLFPTLEIETISPSIPSYFKNSDCPTKPIVAIHTRRPEDTLKIIKSFYIKNPHFKWITFRDLRGMDKKLFAKTLSESCVSVWVDDISSFGTFPIESMKCNVPVIGKIPNMVPEWMEEGEDDKNITIAENGIWTTDFYKIPDLISTYIRLWLEDSLPNDLFEKMSDTVNGKYDQNNLKENITKVYTKLIEKRKAELRSSINNILSLNK